MSPCQGECREFEPRIPLQLNTMIQTYCGLEYTSWRIDDSFFKRFAELESQVTDALNSKMTWDAPELVGRGASIRSSVVFGLHGYRYLYHVINEHVMFYSNLFERTKDRVLRINRQWANEMKPNAMGRIHDHSRALVCIFYLNASKESSNLVFVDSKHRDKFMQTEDCIPNEDKLSIPVESGMCVLHDGRILHAVSKNTSPEPRQCFVFEYNIF